MMRSLTMLPRCDPGRCVACGGPTCPDGMKVMIRRGVAGAPTFPRWLQMAVGACTACTAAALPSTALGQRDAPIEEVVVTSSIVETPRRQIGAAVSVVDGGEVELRG